MGANSRVNWWALRGVGGVIRIGSDSIIECRVMFDSTVGRVVIGDRCYIGNSLIISSKSIIIADDVIISWGVTIVDHNSHSLDWEMRRNDVLDWAGGKKNWGDVAVAPVTIGSKVWIGFGASILKGVNIGEGAIVGAGSVVTKDVAPYTVVAGNPARVVRRLGLAEIRR